MSKSIEDAVRDAMSASEANDAETSPECVSAPQTPQPSQTPLPSQTPQTDPARGQSPQAESPPRYAPVRFFAFATLAPLGLLGLAALFGGLFAWIALLYVTVLSALLDEITARAFPDAPEGAEFPAANSLLVTLAIAHFAALLLAIFALTGGTGIGVGAKIAVLLGFGLFFGQVSNSTAHELIHRSDKRLFQLGSWIYISLLFGHHTSAHRLVHHRFVATPHDPNTAELGESFYAFFPRAWIGSFTSGFEMEEARTQTRKAAGKRAINPYYIYSLGSFLCIVLVIALMGVWGLIAYLALALYAQMQLMLSDYVQHYGLTRAPTGLDSFEPVDARHSWDARAKLSSLWMMNAPRHSDHHAHPNRAYPALRLGQIEATRPILPRSLPVMATLALMPRLWRRVMDRRVKALRKAQATTGETAPHTAPLRKAAEM